MVQYSSKKPFVYTVFAAITVCLIIAMSGCAQEPAWKAVNDQLIAENNINVRELSFNTETGVVSNLQDGVVTDMSDLAEIELAPGVKATPYWGRGNLICKVTMDPGSEIPRETLPSERIMIVMEGSVEQLVNGQMVEMKSEAPEPMYYFSTGYIGERNFVYLEEGTDNQVKAGPDGAVIYEFYYPVRTDYMEKAGATPPANIKAPGKLATPTFPANKVLNLYDVQYTELVPGAWSRIINGKGIQVSVIDMFPGIEFGLHNHPEEQVMTVHRGAIDEYILDGTQLMEKNPETGKQSVLFLPAQMVHGGMLSEKGCDAFDVFYPVREDYTNKMEDMLDRYHSIIPEGEEVKLLADGFKFTEGPTWLDGEYYFSSMYFDIPSGTWALDPSKSDLIAMKPDGTWRYVLKGKMQTNGLMVKGNGNIVACDMAGHRVIELAPDGRVVKVLATKITAGDVHKGLRIDGPNDLVIDAKGGIYFTDPQFINDERARPSKTINYIRPDGEVICVYENPGNKEMQMTNGVLLSPDGKTLYCCSTYEIKSMDGYHSEADNYIYAWDVNEDGTLSNRRRAGAMVVPPTELDRGDRTTCADGMTIDEDGNVYVATNTGLQILSPEGEYIGTIHTPTFPVSVCFGGENFDTLFMTCWDKIYTIKTNTKGLVYPLQ